MDNEALNANFKKEKKPLITTSTQYEAIIVLEKFDANLKCNNNNSNIKPKNNGNYDEIHGLEYKINNQSTVHSSLPSSKVEDNNYVDDFITSKAGYTKYHFHLILINTIVFFMIGSEFVITNLLLSTLKSEWNLSEIKAIGLSSSLFVGILITSILSGSINSNYGRRSPTIVGCAVICVFSIFTAFVNNYWLMMLTKILVGIGIGTVIPSMTSLVTECIPNNNRSLVLNGVWGLYPLGIIYVCYISIYFIKRNIFEWRYACLINSLTSILVFYLIFFLDESPRYLFLKVTSHNKSQEDYNIIDENNPLIKEGFQILNKIGKSANVKLNEETKQNIINQLKKEKNVNDMEYKSHHDTLEDSGLNKSIRQKTKSKFSFRLFFTRENYSTSIYLVCLWYLTSLISFGLLIVLPKHYELILKNDKSESLKNMILTMYIFFPCPIIRGYISDLKYFGRRFTMVIGFSGAALFSLICFITESKIFFFSGVLNFFINISLGVVGVYTSEFYDTLLRSGALGMGNAFTRIGGITAPFIVNLADSLLYKGSFLFFFIFSIIGSAISFMLEESIDKKIK